MTVYSTSSSLWCTRNYKLNWRWSEARKGQLTDLEDVMMWTGANLERVLSCNINYATLRKINDILCTVDKKRNLMILSQMKQVFSNFLHNILWYRAEFLQVKHSVWQPKRLPVWQLKICTWLSSVILLLTWTNASFGNVILIFVNNLLLGTIRRHWLLTFFNLQYTKPAIPEGELKKKKFMKDGRNNTENHTETINTEIKQVKIAIIKC